MSMARFNADVFVEYMVKKKFGLRDVLLVTGSFMFASALLFLSIPLLAGFGEMALQLLFFLFVGICIGMYYLITSRNLEFEYAYTNGSMSIDKIINRKSRKRLASFDVKKIEDIGLYEPSKLSSKKFDKKIFAATHDDGRNAHYVVYRSNKTGLTLLVFNPNERIINEMQFLIPREARMAFYGK